MALDQQSLAANLGEDMNDCPTSWIVYGPFEVKHIVGRLLAEVPPLTSSTADADGFAVSPGGKYRWIFVDADLGSAAFVIPQNQNQFEVDMREPLLGLDGGLAVTSCIYGNVNDKVWNTLGGAGRRLVVAAQDFLPAQ